jgi:putative MATE family efflux protein
MPSQKELTLLTSGNPARRIVVFALPLLVGDFLYVFYTMTDAFIVGRWLGINGLAAVGASYSIIGFVFGFIYGLTDGFAVITAQRVGAGDAEGIRRSVAAGLSLCLFTSIFITVLLLPFCRVFLSLMHTPIEIMDDAYGYVFITLAGSFIGIFSNMLAGIIRAGGDSFTPTVFFLVGIVSNIFLDILCVVVFHWGVRGAAAASVFSQFISCVLFLLFRIRRFSRFFPQRQDWLAGRRDFGVHLSLGISMGLLHSIVEAGNILVQAAVNGLGALTIAAVSAAQRVRGLNMMPLFALSRAMTTYTAQNYGAGKMDRVYKGIFQACLISLGLGVFMATMNQFTGAPIAALFLKDSPEAVALAHRFILYTGYTVFILGIMLVFRSSLQGLGMRRAPLLCGIMETVMSILAAFVLIPRLGFTGVCLVNPLSWLASGIPLYIAFGVLKKRFTKNSDSGII